MPDPNKYKNIDDYMAVCVPMVIREGSTQDQAVGKCEGMWHGKSIGLKLNAKINNDYDVGYLAGMSKDRTTVYVDKDLDPTININGKEIDPRPFLYTHETTECAWMDQGDTYQEAHKKATEAEREHIEKEGVNWDCYMKALHPYIKSDESKDSHFPPDIDPKPYEDEKDSKEIKEIDESKSV
jgi:hypothetical protein